MVFLFCCWSCNILVLFIFTKGGVQEWKTLFPSQHLREFVIIHTCHCVFVSNLHSAVSSKRLGSGSLSFAILPLPTSTVPGRTWMYNQSLLNEQFDKLRISPKKGPYI